MARGRGARVGRGTAAAEERTEGGGRVTRPRVPSLDRDGYEVIPNFPFPGWTAPASYVGRDVKLCFSYGTASPCRETMWVAVTDQAAGLATGTLLSTPAAKPRGARLRRGSRLLFSCDLVVDLYDEERERRRQAAFDWLMSLPLDVRRTVLAVLRAADAQGLAS